MNLVRIIYILIMSIIFVSTVASNDANCESIEVKMRKTLYKTDSDQYKNYKYRLIKLLLEKTKHEFGDYEIVLSKLESQERIIHEVINGNLDLIMTATSKDREERLIPIRIPIYKGLYGYRIFRINKNDQEKFKSIKNEDELKNLVAGQGKQWPDYKILEANGYKVIGPHSHVLLFDMLEARRFDYFPRGVHEPWLELKRFPKKHFIVESNLCISYPLPGYIFVSPQNKKLAIRLEKGFKMALEDGSFDELFYNHPDIKETLEKANLKKRKIFYLKNPLLSKDTPLDIDSYWYKP